MKKTNPAIKDHLDTMDIIDFTKDLADAVFEVQDDGSVSYVPYMYDLNFKLLFYLYCVEGLEFETDESGKTENILIAVENDDEVNRLFSDYMNGKYKMLPIWRQISTIRKNASDMADFRKHMMYKDRGDEVGKLISSLAAIGEMISSIDFSRIDNRVMTQIFMTSFIKAGIKPDQIQQIADALTAKKDDGDGH